MYNARFESFSASALSIRCFLLVNHKQMMTYWYRVGKGPGSDDKIKNNLPTMQISIVLHNGYAYLCHEKNQIGL